MAALLFAAPAQAAERPDRSHGIFFNRSGATAESVAADRTRCAAIAAGTDSQVTAATLLTSGLIGIIGGEIAGGRLRRVNTENCMVIRGWRLFAFTSSEGKAFKALAEPQQLAEMRALVAADTPARGTLLRTWNNDYAEPKFWQKGLIAALIALALAVPALAGPLINQVDIAKLPLAAPKPDEAMVVVRFFAAGMVGDNRVTFLRVDPQSGAVLTGADGKPEGFRTSFSYSLFGGAKGVRVARVAIVPAGRYVMASRTLNGQMTDSFCFGAPRFDLAAGSVTYLGDFEMMILRKAPDRELRSAMIPSADLKAARADLAKSYPAEAQRLAPWQPTNGASLPCDGDEFTAYALPGAPGEPVAAH